MCVGTERRQKRLCCFSRCYFCFIVKFANVIMCCVRFCFLISISCIYNICSLLLIDGFIVCKQRRRKSWRCRLFWLCCIMRCKENQSIWRISLFRNRNVGVSCMFFAYTWLQCIIVIIIIIIACLQGLQVCWWNIILIHDCQEICHVLVKHLSITRKMFIEGCCCWWCF